MRVLPYLAVFTFVAGLSLLVAGYSIRSAGDPDPEPSAPFDLLPTLLSETPTATATGAPTATPTPRPFDGKVARMVAPDIGIDHAIEEVGLVDNQLDVPKDGVNKIGWYSNYEQPGHGKNAVFAAHVNFNKKEGPFAQLKTVSERDQILVVMEGGPTYTYEVVVFRRYDVDTIPTGDLIAAPDRPAGQEWITLITCGGEFVADPGSEFGHYLQRDVVIARRID